MPGHVDNPTKALTIGNGLFASVHLSVSIYTGRCDDRHDRRHASNATGDSCGGQPETRSRNRRLSDVSMMLEVTLLIVHPCSNKTMMQQEKQSENYK